jgi:hypothetical protein
MHTKLVVLGLIFAVSAASTAHAQVTVDVSKINCDQFVHHKVGDEFEVTRKAKELGLTGLRGGHKRKPKLE